MIKSLQNYVVHIRDSVGRIHDIQACGNTITAALTAAMTHAGEMYDPPLVVIAFEPLIPEMTDVD